MMQAEGGQIASFREIHKNAWLKRIPPNTNNKLLSQKKVTVERWWTVFCVHGDVEPFLEGYTEAGGVVASHMPRWRAPLARAIHVSGSVGPAKPHSEYEFVVALQDGTVRLIAPSWESMQDWVDTLRNKLREMKILSPKENVYSKAPEQTRPRAPTRDPTSPLPAPPPGPITRVPGTEPSIRPLPTLSNFPLPPLIPPPSPVLSASASPSVSPPITPPSSTASNVNEIASNISSETTSEVSSNSEINQSSRDATGVSSENVEIVVSPSCSYEAEKPNIPELSSVKKDSKCVPKLKNESHQSSTELLDVFHKSDLKNIPKSINTSVASTSDSCYDYNKILNVAASQKSIDDSISKVEMDFSKLVFNSEYPYKFNPKCNEAAGSSNFNPNVDQKSIEFTSSVANVSGMNICLVDSVLEHRIKTESDRNFFDEFDADDNSVLPSTLVTTTSNITITESGDIKAKYAQVDLKAKKFEKFKKNLLEPSIAKKTNNISSVDIPVVNNKTVQSSALTSNKLKPAVSPRTIIFKNSDEGSMNNPTNIFLSNDKTQECRDDGLSESFLKIDNVKTSEDKPVAAERKKGITNKRNNDYDNQSIVNFTASNGSSPHDSSNVTIITVSNDTSNNKSVVLNDGLIKINQLCKSSSDSSHVNVSSCTENVTVNKCPEEKPKNDKNEVPNFRVSIGSGYGHVRHSTTIGVESNSNSEKSLNNLEGLNKFQKNILDSENIVSTSKADKFSNSNILLIDHTPSTSNRFSFDQPNIDKMDYLKTVTASSLPNTPRQLDNSTSNVEIINVKNSLRKGEGLYESVFTPFTVTKGSKISADNVTNHIDFNSSNTTLNEETSSKSILTPHNYEFLSWKKNEVNGIESNDGAGSSNPHNSEPQISQMPANYNRGTPVVMREINLSEYRPQPMPQQFDELPQESIHPIAKNSKHGLFTRGLTELNIVSKFRNIGQSTSSKTPLLKNSQFYSYVEFDSLPSTSSSDQRQENKRNIPFSTKLNHLFYKTGDDKNNMKGSDLSNVKRIESSLRRNWSEHNDRTVLPVVKNAAELKAHRSRPIQKSPPKSQNMNKNSDEKQTRRRSSSLSESHISSAETSTNSIEIPKENFPSNNVNGNENPPILQPMNLREKQVAKLRGEMALASGFRLRLRSKDSLGEALALADGFGTVWVCGWKQQTHPQLYNALRIGDQLTAVGDTMITNVKQAKNALKDLFFVELLIKRLPHAHVYTLKKNSDTQDLGLILDNATIVTVIPGSPAAKMRVPPNGTLTEVNGRPLNLLLKKGDSQVKNRLNAIGRDVSIVVQPTEFVALLKASLRNMRNHKDYIVQ